MMGEKEVGLRSFIKMLSPSTPTRLKSQVVIVVPIFAPIITGIACAKRISPEFTKPTTITVVADEL